MANLANLKLDANVQESTGNFEVLPEGEYKMVITKDLLKSNSTNTGEILKLKLQVVSGPSTGVIIDDSINLTNPSAKCQAIGQGTLKKICRLCNVGYPPPDGQTNALYGKPMIVRVGIGNFTSNTSGNELQSNEVKGYSAVKGYAAVKETETVKPVDSDW